MSTRSFCESGDDFCVFKISCSSYPDEEELEVEDELEEEIPEELLEEELDIPEELLEEELEIPEDEEEELGEELLDEKMLLIVHVEPLSVGDWLLKGSPNQSSWQGCSSDSEVKMVSPSATARIIDNSPQTFLRTWM